MKVIRLIVAIFYPIIYIVFFPFIIVSELVKTTIQYFAEMFMDLSCNYVDNIKICLARFKTY